MSNDDIEAFARQADHWACFDAEGPCIDYQDDRLRGDLRTFAKLCFNDPVTDRDPRMLWEIFLSTPAYKSRVEQVTRNKETDHGGREED